MEKIDAIEVETGREVVLVIGNGGGSTEMVKETTTTVAGEIEKKETIEITKFGLSNKDRKKMAKKLKMMSVPKVVVSRETSAADDEAAAAVRSEGAVQGCRIMVSNTKKSLLFYLNLAKVYLVETLISFNLGILLAIRNTCSDFESDSKILGLSYLKMRCNLRLKFHVVELLLEFSKC